MFFDYMSDLHIDFWANFNSNTTKAEKTTRKLANEMVPEFPSPLLILGGDIGHYNIQNTWFLDELSKSYKKILLVFGNHDYYLISNRQFKKYKRSSKNRIDEMKKWIANHNSIELLDGSIIDFEGVNFGGCGMWYDFSYGINELGQSIDEVHETWWNNSSDSVKINGIDLEEHFLFEKEKLKFIMDDSDVLITHMGPDWLFSPYKGNRHIHNSYYFFDGKDIIDNHIEKIWCFGHVHMDLDVYKNGNRWISYGLGYPDERYKEILKFKQIEV